MLWNDLSGRVADGLLAELVTNVMDEYTRRRAI